MEMRFDKEIYSKEVLLKTSYSFSDRVYLHLQQDENSWIVSWLNMEEHTDLKPESFENELISQQLRQILVAKTADIRKIVMSRAFASSMMEITSTPYMESVPLEAVGNLQDMDEESADILKGWFDP